MRKRLILAGGVIAVIVCAALNVLTAQMQTSDRVDFRRDVQPLFKTHCLDCHGPKQQKNGFRLEHPQR